MYVRKVGLDVAARYIDGADDEFPDLTTNDPRGNLKSGSLRARARARGPRPPRDLKFKCREAGTNGRVIHRTLRSQEHETHTRTAPAAGAPVEVGNLVFESVVPAFEEDRDDGGRAEEEGECVYGQGGDDKTGDRWTGG